MYDCENKSCTFSTLQVQKIQRIISNKADLLFFYQSLFLYSLCLADVAERFKAVSLSLFCVWCVRICGLYFFLFIFWLMWSRCRWTQQLCKDADLTCVRRTCALSCGWVFVALKRLFHYSLSVFKCHPVWRHKKNDMISVFKLSDLRIKNEKTEH